MYIKHPWFYALIDRQSPGACISSCSRTTQWRGSTARGLSITCNTATRRFRCTCLAVESDNNGGKPRVSTRFPSKGGGGVHVAVSLHLRPAGGSHPGSLALVSAATEPESNPPGMKQEQQTKRIVVVEPRTDHEVELRVLRPVCRGAAAEVAVPAETTSSTSAEEEELSIAMTSRGTSPAVHPGEHAKLCLPFECLAAHPSHLPPTKHAHTYIVYI